MHKVGGCETYFFNPQFSIWICGFNCYFIFITISHMSWVDWMNELNSFYTIFFQFWIINNHGISFHFPLVVQIYSVECFFFVIFTGLNLLGGVLRSIIIIRYVKVIQTFNIFLTSSNTTWKIYFFISYYF